VPLSDHEQRLLDQIERALYAEDPKFASSYRSTNLRKHYSRRILRCALLFILGIILLMVGVISKEPLVGVFGFVVMLAALLFGVTSWQRLTGHREGGRQNRPQGAPSVAAVTRLRPRRERRRGSWKGRLEERWRRRWDERGH
jgi:Protein of unknown function (DUF3040)